MARSTGDRNPLGARELVPDGESTRTASPAVCTGATHRLSDIATLRPPKRGGAEKDGYTRTEAEKELRPLKPLIEGVAVWVPVEDDRALRRAEPDLDVVARAALL